MKTSLSFAAIILVALGTASMSENVSAQLKEVPQGVAFAERNLGGPRLGVTYILGENTELVKKLQE